MPDVAVRDFVSPFLCGVRRSEVLALALILRCRCPLRVGPTFLCVHRARSEHSGDGEPDDSGVAQSRISDRFR